jgi:hypothetical protein
MSIIKICEPEWHTNNNYGHEDIIVRRILNISGPMNNDCIPQNIPASIRYPSPEFEFTAKCKITTSVTIHNIMVGLYLPKDITEQIALALGDDIISNRRTENECIVVAVGLKREYLIWSSKLDNHHTSHPEYLHDCMIEVKGVFELSYIFDKCRESHDSVCFNDRHSKSWKLRVKCNRANVVGFKRGDEWI